MKQQKVSLHVFMKKRVRYERAVFQVYADHMRIQNFGLRGEGADPEAIYNLLDLKILYGN
jgi:hypothetical protein